MPENFVKTVSFNYTTDRAILVLANAGAEHSGCSVTEFLRRVLEAELPRYAPYYSNTNSVL